MKLKDNKSSSDASDPFGFIPPKKYLGQVFLTDENITNKIIEACRLRNTDTVLEIGPGPGNLTRILASYVQEVIAIEKDKRFYEELKTRLEGSNVRIILADFLKWDISQLPKNLIVVGNLPYYISSPIMGKILEYRKHFKSAFVTVQLEFGKRMVAKVGTRDYSALTCFIQYYTDAKMLFKISRTSFRPTPKVDSCFMQISIHEKPLYPAFDEPQLFNIIHHAFQQRRKTLPNAFRAVIDKDKLSCILDTLKIDPKLRPEDLSLKNFADIANALE